MSHTRYNLLMQQIKERLQKENYPAGAANDPDAPWNQSDPTAQQGSSVKTNLDLIAGDPDNEALVGDGSGKYYVINREMLHYNDELFRDLVGQFGYLPYTEEGPDEDGLPSKDYHWDQAELKFDDLLSATQSAINNNSLDTPEEYDSGEGFAFELTPELAYQLWRNHSDLAKHPAVESMIDPKRIA